MEETIVQSADVNEFAIVEIMGHRKLVGAISEIERYGAKFLRVVPMYQGSLMDVDTLVSPPSIFCLTPISHEAAIRLCPKERWQLPDVVLCAAYPPALPCSEAKEDSDAYEVPHYYCGEIINDRAHGLDI